MEEQLVQFFFDLINIPRPEFREVVMKSMEIHFSTD